MLRIPQYTSRSSKFKHKLMYIFGPNGLYIRFSWTVLCPFILSLLLIASVVGYRRIKFAGIDIPILYELVAWVVMVGPLLVIPIIAIIQIRQNWMEGKTTRSLFDSNNWCQDDVGNEQFEFVERSVRPSTRRIPNRENTYMYIDAVSRGPTSKSRIHPMEQYGWRTGRLRDWQIDNSRQESVDSFASKSMSSQKSTLGGDFALFGSPPVSNAFLISDAVTVRTRPIRQANVVEEDVKVDDKIVEVAEEIERNLKEPKRKIHSEPPIPASPCPPRRHSPCRSEPPICQSQPPLKSIRSISESEVECSSNSDEDDNGSESTILKG
ncbi:hypothetical protein WR25_09614 isoform A [Diploscapter pachys]|uniref:Uncharacterized protein n=1 Tax=Diploscapter pachys TaxID=2018661 RepID=A0A2A2LMG7_9BILA|nr:hypothetical protein WR25_09614 isoform A [Diploscapter pachys]